MRYYIIEAKRRWFANTRKLLYTLLIVTHGFIITYVIWLLRFIILQRKQILKFVTLKKILKPAEDWRGWTRRYVYKGFRHGRWTDKANINEVGRTKLVTSIEIVMINNKLFYILKSSFNHIHVKSYAYPKGFKSQELISWFFYILLAVYRFS